jgi:restriction system protein
MQNHEVIPAFDMLLEELDAIIPELNQKGAHLMEEKKYSKARDIITKAESVITFQEKVRALRDEWLNLEVPATRKKAKKKKPVKRKVTKLLKQGLRTPNDAFHLPILKALVQLGGSGQVQDVLKAVEEMMADQLNKYDYQSIPSNPKIIRWENNAQWARVKLIEQGFMASDSPRGIWEITDAGRERVAQSDQ